MKTNEKIAKGTILVCIQNQTTSCGIMYCKKGSIVKCAREPKSYHSSVSIYRNERDETKDKWLPVDKRKLRIANNEEIQMYSEGKHSLEPVES